MANEQINLVRIRNKINTPAAWAMSNPILYDGEIAYVKDGYNNLAYKIGNGIDTYSNLPFTYKSEDYKIAEIYELEASRDGSSYAITAYHGSEKYINIPDFFGGLPVIMIGNGAFSSYTTNSRLSCPNSIRLPRYLVGLGSSLFNSADLSSTKLYISASSTINLSGTDLDSCKTYYYDSSASSSGGGTTTTGLTSGRYLFYKTANNTLIGNLSQFNTIEDASYMYYQNTGNDTISVDLPNAIVAESAFAECEASSISLTENSLTNVVYAPSMFNGAKITSIPYNDSADGIYTLRLNSATNIDYIFNGTNIGTGASSIILSVPCVTSSRYAFRNATITQVISFNLGAAEIDLTGAFYNAVIDKGVYVGLNSNVINTGIVNTTNMFYNTTINPSANMLLSFLADIDLSTVKASTSSDSDLVTILTNIVTKLPTGNASNAHTVTLPARLQSQLSSITTKTGWTLAFSDTI